MIRFSLLINSKLAGILDFDLFKLNSLNLFDPVHVLIVHMIYIV